MSKPLEVDYNVRVDTFSLVDMANSSASDVIYADPQQHVFVSTLRSFSPVKVSGKEIPLIQTKTCKGYYLTYDEFQALNAKKK